jgi:hypothetical protein
MKFLEWLQFCLDNNYDIDWFGILGYANLPGFYPISFTGRIDNVGWL